MSKFKIFYSWQSDLPKNKTKSFIRECIDEAIDLAQETEAIEAERDEATTGTTGAPNIVTTLFSKIDNCDLFIADVSLCYTDNPLQKKYSPNPNVLLELGYAVKTLGWDRIICLCNTEFGDSYPFDISHNRITTFSLQGKAKNDVKYTIAKIIFSNIRNLRIFPPLVKSGMATHIIGCYDVETHTIQDKIIPLDIANQESYTLHNKELLNDSRKLFDEIQALTHKMHTEKNPENHLNPDLAKEVHTAFETKNINSNATYLLSKLNSQFETPVVWKYTDDDTFRIESMLGCTVPIDFFDLGDLKQTKNIYDINKPDYKGTTDELLKYEKLQSLSSNLLLLDLRRKYLKTFDNMFFIPLAIRNSSMLQDEDIHIAIYVDAGEIVNPTKNLISDECEGLQGVLCKDDTIELDPGIIGELFCLSEDGFIHIEDIPYIPPNGASNLPLLLDGRRIYSGKTEVDYAEELQQFIATSASGNYYEFDIAKLRPNECKWLCCGMLIKPHDDKIILRYQIHSARSAGNLHGILEM